MKYANGSKGISARIRQQRAEMRQSERAAQPTPKPPAPRTSTEPESDRYLFLAETHYAARRRRERFLGADLLGEPAWDILLDLYIAWKRGQAVSTSSACVGAQVPPTTALRWLQVLQDRGLIERFGDERDQRRTLVRLSHQGTIALDRYFEANWAAFDGAEMTARWNSVAVGVRNPTRRPER